MCALGGSYTKEVKHSKARYMKQIDRSRDTAFVMVIVKYHIPLNFTFSVPPFTFMYIIVEFIILRYDINFAV